MITISVGGAGIFIHARLLAFMYVCFDLMIKSLNYMYIHVHVPVSKYICLCPLQRKHALTHIELYTGTIIFNMNGMYILILHVPAYIYEFIKLLAIGISEFQLEEYKVLG